MTSVRSLHQDDPTKFDATRRVEFFNGVTSGSGELAINYDPPFAAPPLVFIDANNLATNQWARITSQDENGVTVQAHQRNSTNLLGIEILLAATVTANGVAVSLAVIGQ